MKKKTKLAAVTEQQIVERLCGMTVRDYALLEQYFRQLLLRVPSFPPDEPQSELREPIARRIAATFVNRRR